MVDLVFILLHYSEHEEERPPARAGGVVAENWLWTSSGEEDFYSIAWWGTLEWARAHWWGHVTQAKSSNSSRELIKPLSATETGWEGLRNCLRSQKLNLETWTSLWEFRTQEELWRNSILSDMVTMLLILKINLAFLILLSLTRPIPSRVPPPPKQKKNLAFSAFFVWNSFLFFSELLVRRRSGTPIPRLWFILGPGILQE